RARWRGGDHDHADPARRHRPAGAHRLRGRDQPGDVRDPRDRADAADHRAEPRGEEVMTATHSAETGTRTAAAGAAEPATGSPAPRTPRSPRRRPRPATALRYLALVIMLIVLAGPLLWQLSLSLK